MVRPVESLFRLVVFAEVECQLMGSIHFCGEVWFLQKKLAVDLVEPLGIENIQSAAVKMRIDWATFAPEFLCGLFDFF